jgi:hypothetical protein
MIPWMMEKTSLSESDRVGVPTLFDSHGRQFCIEQAVWLVIEASS